jgi:hypothetical protein
MDIIFYQEEAGGNMRVLRRLIDGLDERLRLSAHLLRDDWIERQCERVWKLGPFGKFSMAVWIATMVLLGHFLGTHANQPALFVTARALRHRTRPRHRRFDHRARHRCRARIPGKAPPLWKRRGLGGSTNHVEAWNPKQGGK